jgi:hypothetical protein
VATEEVAVEYAFPSWEEYSRVMNSLAAALRVTLAELDADVRAEVEAAARARLDRFLTPDGYVLPGLALVTSAR